MQYYKILDTVRGFHTVLVCENEIPRSKMNFYFEIDDKCAEVQRLTQMLVVTRHNVPNANFDHNFALQFHDLLSLYEGIVNIEQLFLDHRKTSWSYQILARLGHTLDTTINKINYKSNIKNLVIWYEIRTMNHSQLFGTNIISSTDYKSSTVTETK